MISVFLMRKLRFSEVKEEPPLLRARVWTQAQTGWLQSVLMHLLCIKRLIYMSNVMCWLPTWLCVYYPLECQVLHELRSFSLHHDQFFCAGGNGQGGRHWWIFRDSYNLSEQGSLQYPQDIGTQTQLPTSSSGAGFPVVPARLHTGSWKAWQQPPPGGFLSGINMSPSELKRKITCESFVLKWGWEGGDSTVFPVFTFTCWTLDLWRRRHWWFCHWHHRSGALIDTKEISRLLNDWLYHVTTGILRPVLISWCTVYSGVMLGCGDSCDFHGIKTLIFVLFYSK